jgi:hypothetical protein
VQLVTQTGKPIAQVARELGIRPALTPTAGVAPSSERKPRCTNPAKSGLYGFRGLPHPNSRDDLLLDLW